MAENRRQVLEMLAAGRVTAEEADRLLTALGEEQTPAGRAAPPAKPKFLRVMVDAQDDEDGPVKSTSGSRWRCCGRASGSPA